MQISLKLLLDRRSFSFQSNSETSLLTNLFHHSDVLHFLPNIIISPPLTFLLIKVTVSYSVSLCDIVKLLSLWGQSSAVLLQEHNEKLQQIYLIYFFASRFSQSSLITVFIFLMIWIVHFNFNFLDSYWKISLTISKPFTLKSSKTFPVFTYKSFFTLNSRFKLFCFHQSVMSIHKYFCELSAKAVRKNLKLLRIDRPITL